MPSKSPFIDVKTQQMFLPINDCGIYIYITCHVSFADLEVETWMVNFNS